MNSSITHDSRDGVVRESQAPEIWTTPVLYCARLRHAEILNYNRGVVFRSVICVHEVVELCQITVLTNKVAYSVKHEGRERAVTAPQSVWIIAHQAKASPRLIVSKRNDQRLRQQAKGTLGLRQAPQ